MRRIKVKLDEIPHEMLTNADQTSISLYDNNITSIPPEIGNLVNLTELYLSKNKITLIPQEIGRLVNLTEISLSDNKITSIPSDIGNLVKLNVLNLSKNQIILLPPEIGNLVDLTKLNLSENQITELPPEIGNLINLTKLNLSQNQITELPQQITQLIHLQELVLNINRLDARVLSTIIALSEKLVSPNKENFNLTIGGNPIIFPTIEDANLKALNDEDVVYVSILTHGIIPLNSENQLIEVELPPTVNTFEIQRVCSLSAVNRAATSKAEVFASLIKSQFDKPGKCDDGECSFDTEFTEKCKQIEGDLTCELVNTTDPHDKRFVERYNSRYPKSKVFKKKYGKKIFYFNNIEYFKKGKDSNDWKIVMYIKKKDSTLSIDITPYVIRDTDKFRFFERFIYFVVNKGSDFSESIYNRLQYSFSIDAIITFLNTIMGYKNIKIVDFSCGLFGKESYSALSGYTIAEDKDITEENLSSIAEQLDPHYGGRKQRRTAMKRKQTRRAITKKRGTKKRDTKKRGTKTKK